MGDRSFLLNTHLAEFVGTELGLHEVSGSGEHEHCKAEDGGNQEHGNLLSKIDNVDLRQKLLHLTVL